MNVYLNEAEVAVLRALSEKSRRWWTSVELADLLELPPYVTRSALRQLKRHRLVTHDAGLKTYAPRRGDWAITGLGEAELGRREAAASQLALDIIKGGGGYVG